MSWPPVQAQRPRKNRSDRRTRPRHRPDAHDRGPGVIWVDQRDGGAHSAQCRRRPCMTPAPHRASCAAARDGGSKAPAITGRGAVGGPRDAAEKLSTFGAKLVSCWVLRLSAAARWQAEGVDLRRRHPCRVGRWRRRSAGLDAAVGGGAACWPSASPTAPMRATPFGY